MGELVLPPGKRIAVNLGVDFDAQSIWMGAINHVTPATMARGEFAARVGVPRLLGLHAELGVRTTYFIPGHTLDTFPKVCAAIQEHGHELGHHGYYHESPRAVSSDTYRRLIELAFKSFERFDTRPTGYRAWDPREDTLDILEEYGFRYDSSLMADDFTPYHPQRWRVRWENGNVAGRASSILEIPVSWALDDFPVMTHVPGLQAGLGDTDVWLTHHRAAFDYAYANVPNACFAPVVHPQSIGQAHVIMAYRQLIEYIAQHSGVWFATLAEIAGCWQDDAEDRRLMKLADDRGVDPPPPDANLDDRAWRH